MRKLSYILKEITIILKYRIFNRQKIIFKNDGIIQFENKSILYRLGWWDKYTLEQMDEFVKEFKD